MWHGVSCCPQSQGRGRPGLGSPDLHPGWGSGQCGVPQVWPEPVRLVSWMRCMPSTCFSTWAGRASRDPDACLRFRSAVSPPGWRLLSARRRAGWRPRFVFPGRPRAPRSAGRSPRFCRARRHFPLPGIHSITRSSRSRRLARPSIHHEARFRFREPPLGARHSR